MARGENLGNFPDLTQVAAEPAKPSIQITTDKLADSRAGRSIQITRLHAPGPDDAGRPAVLIIAGIDPRHAHVSEVAAALIDRLAKDHASTLSRGDIYILPQLNPDAFVTPQTPLRADSPRNAAAPNTIDADRDGRFNEDPPVDLDGDGRVLQMRIKNPPPGIGIRAEYVTEDGDPRLLRRADAGKSERPIYAFLAESRDADHDGLFGEDGFDGVELDRNFPYHWPEFRDEAGRVPLSEPETRALAEWLLAHDNVVAVMVYTPADNLVNIPPGGKMDETGGAPATNHILDEDRGQWERIGAKFKEITHHKEAPTRDNEGTFQGWAYAHLGLWSFSTPIWVRPDQCPGAIPNPGGTAGATPSADTKGAAESPKPPDEKPKAEKPESEKPQDGEAKVEKNKEDKPKDPPPPPGPAKIDTEDGKWLAYSDSLIAAGKPGGFAPWKSFKHPQLGDVEIGGWLPGFRQSIPTEDIPRLVGEQAAFVTDLLNRLPRLTVSGPRIERLGDSIWRISIDAVNEGELPTRTNMGVRIHRLPPTRWTIGIERLRLLSGDRTQKSDTIPGGGTLAASWTISAKPGDTIKLSLKSPECGDRDIDVKLDAPKEANP
jgi:hypothetical protein